MPTRGRVLARLDDWDRRLATLETVLLGTILLGMLLASVLQILLRNFAGTALPGLETASRRAVLWIALLGASLATHRGAHLAVDALENLLPQRLRRVLAVVTNAVAAAISAVLLRAALGFVSAEAAFGGSGASLTAAVLPLGFAVMTLRFTFTSVRHALGAR